MKRFAGLWLLCVICLFAGCSSYYYQEGKSFSECERDRADCFEELKKRADWDIPGDYERKFMEDGMKKKGYRLVKQSELPVDVKRQDPPDSVVGRIYEARYGIAGTVD
jgi:hypothetical protein